MKAKKLTSNLIYDPDIEPFYTSEIKHNDRDIVIYDLDKHCNKTLLARYAFIIEYYTDKSECLIAPKVFAENLHLTDDKVLEQYYITQHQARNKYNSKIVMLSGLTILFIIALVLVILGILKLNPLFLTIPYALYYINVQFIQKNLVLKNSYSNYIKVLENEYSKETVRDNLDSIIEYTKEIDYMDYKTKMRTINHFEKLRNLL